MTAGTLLLGVEETCSEQRRLKYIPSGGGVVEVEQGYVGTSGIGDVVECTMGSCSLLLSSIGSIVSSQLRLIPGED